MDMPLVAYGHSGYPLLMFPTAAADYLVYERFHLVDAIKPLIDRGQIRAYSINSVNKYSLLNRESHPSWKVEMLARYDNYIMEEVLPLIRNECGQDAKPLTTGTRMEIRMTMMLMATSTSVRVKAGRRGEGRGVRGERMRNTESSRPSRAWPLTADP